MTPAELPDFWRRLADWLEHNVTGPGAEVPAERCRIYRRCADDVDEALARS